MVGEAMSVKLLKSILILLFLLVNTQIANAYTIDSIEGKIIEIDDGNCELEFDIYYDLSYFEMISLILKSGSEKSLIEIRLKSVDSNIYIKSADDGIASGVIYDYGNKIDGVYYTRAYNFDDKIQEIMLTLPDMAKVEIVDKNYIPKIRHTDSTTDTKFYSPELNEWISGIDVGSIDLTNIDGTIDYRSDFVFDKVGDSWSDTFEIEPSTDAIEIQVNYMDIYTSPTIYDSVIPATLLVDIVSPTGKIYRTSYVKSIHDSTSFSPEYQISSTEGSLILYPENGVWSIKITLEEMGHTDFKNSAGRTMYATYSPAPSISIVIDNRGTIQQTDSLDLYGSYNYPLDGLDLHLDTKSTISNPCQIYDDLYYGFRYNFIEDFKSNVYYTIEDSQFPFMAPKGEIIDNVNRDIAFVTVKKDVRKENVYYLIVIPAYGIVHPFTSPTTIDDYFKGSDLGLNGEVTVGYQENNLYNARHESNFSHKRVVKESDYKVMFESGNKKYPVQDVSPTKMNENVVNMFDVADVAVGSIADIVVPGSGFVYSLGKIYDKDVHARYNWQYAPIDHTKEMRSDSLRFDNGYDQIKIDWLPQEYRPIEFGDSIIVPISVGITEWSNYGEFYVYAKIKFANRHIYIPEIEKNNKDLFPQSYYESIELLVEIDENGEIKNIKKMK